MVQDWKKICEALDNDERSGVWRSHRSFTSFVFDNEERYGKSRNALARLLRMMRMYRSAREEFSGLELPPFGAMSAGVTGVAFNELSRMYSLLDHEDKALLLRQIVLGDLRKEHTSPVLSLYKHLLRRVGRVGRPREDRARFDPNSKDLVADVSFQLFKFFNGLTNIVRVTVLDVEMKAVLSDSNFSVNKVFVLNFDSGATRVACFFSIEQLPLPERACEVFDLFDYLVLSDANAEKDLWAAGEAGLPCLSLQAIGSIESTLWKVQPYTVYQNLSAKFAARVNACSLNAALHQA